ncbi:MAG TPA: PilN domain-containing protein [Terriglobales bacterium]|jgi:type IV pilus assembly protein PilN|nr:PilN domain-containing protein [Terriglobales bacterium]
MRININLASQPYEVAREYKRRMTLLIAALAVAAVVLLGYIFYQRAHSRGINRQLADVQRQIDSLNHEESQARAILNKPANRGIADQSEFLNDLFARKSLSWTHIFTVMEKIMPAGIHVVSMKPEFSKTNDLVLHVMVATDSRDRAVELVRNMEKSAHFRQPQVVAETVVTGTSEQGQAGNIQFDIAAVYLPSAGGDEETSDSGTTTAQNMNGPGAGTAPATTPTRPAMNPAASAGARQPTNFNAAQNRPLPPAATRQH